MLSDSEKTPFHEVLDAVVNSFLGKPYIWGGDDPIVGFDCSGLVQELLASVGMDPPGDQTAQGLHNYFKVNGEKDFPHSLGTLAFYGKSADAITHVAMFLSNDYIVEAGGGGSKTKTAADAAAQNAYVRIRPWNHRKDFVAAYTPKYDQS